MKKPTNTEISLIKNPAPHNCALNIKNVLIGCDYWCYSIMRAWRIVGLTDFRHCSGEGDKVDVSLWTHTAEGRVAHTGKLKYHAETLPWEIRTDVLTAHNDTPTVGQSEEKGDGHNTLNPHLMYLVYTLEIRTKRDLSITSLLATLSFPSSGTISDTAFSKHTHAHTHQAGQSLHSNNLVLEKITHLILGWELRAAFYLHCSLSTLEPAHMQQQSLNIHIL